MKRSEMIQIMRRASATGPSGADPDKYLANILSEMEKAGMIPPDRSGCGCNDPECCGGKDHNWTNEETT